MKATSMIFLLLAMAFSLKAGPEKAIESRINKVTVYPDAAQVSRTARVQLERGTTQLLLDQVSPYIIGRTIQAEGKGNFVILDVKYRLRQPDPMQPDNKPLPPAIQREIKTLTDSLAQLKFDQEYLNARREVLNLEKSVLMGNKYMQGKLDTITQLQYAMTYLRTQLNDINALLFKLKKDEDLMTRQRDAIQERLRVLQAYHAHQVPVVTENPRHQILITVSAEAGTQASLEITYQVSKAGWSPLYDIRAGGQGDAIQLVSKANVFQRTGEDWKDVSLTLSTITPGQGYTKPILQPLYAGYYMPRPAPVAYMSGIESVAYEKRGRPRASSDEMLEDARTLASYTREQTTLTNVEYLISLPYTITGDGDQRVVAIMDKKLEAEFHHYLVPRLEKQAFLVARIAGWNQLELLPGPANIYFEGNYVGETTIQSGIMGDTLELALGKDRSVIVERKKEKDEVKNALFGNQQTRSIYYAIQVRNSKAYPINLVLEDQIPLAASNDIKIKPVHLSSAEHVESTGLLKWRMKLDGRGSKTFTFSYSIDHERGRPLANVY